MGLWRYVGGLLRPGGDQVTDPYLLLIAFRARVLMYRRIAEFCRFTDTPLHLVVGYGAIPVQTFTPQEWRDLLGFEGDDS